MDITSIVNEINDLPNKKTRLRAYFDVLRYLESLSGGINFVQSDFDWINQINIRLNKDIHHEIKKHIQLVNQWIDFEIENG